MKLFARQATQLRRALTILFASAATALVAERLGYAGVYAGTADAAAVGKQALLAIPGAVQLAALWQLRRMAVEAAAGSPFAAAAARGLRRAGVLLIVAALLTLFAAPALHGLLDEARPRLIDFDMTTIITGAIGAALALVARLLDQARAVQSELDEIF